MLRSIIKNSSIFFCLTLLIGCLAEPSSDVNQDKIYTNYEIFYNSNTDKTVVVAQFRFGGPLGTLLELIDEPASVTYDGEVLPYNAFYGGHAKEFAGRMHGGTMLYTDVDGNTFENILPSYEEIEIPESLEEISKSAAFEFTWVGSPISADQTAGVFIGSWTWGRDALFTQNSIGSNNMVMGANQLGQLPLGTSTFHLDRTTELEAMNATSKGGVIKARFRAKNKQITIVE